MAKELKNGAKTAKTKAAKLALNRHLVDIFKYILTPGDNIAQSVLAAILGVADSELSKAKRNRPLWNQKALAKALDLTNDWIRQRGGAALESVDLYNQDTIALVSKIPLSRDEKRDLLKKLGLAPPPETTLESSLLEKLAKDGIWAVFYTCRDRRVGFGETPAIAIATFSIAMHPFETMAVLQETSYDPEIGLPVGQVQVKHNTIEIDIRYKEPDYPVAKYLAPLPSHREINCLRLTALDIKGRDGAIVARPILMVKVGKDADHPMQINQSMEIYNPILSFLSRLEIYDPVFMELAFKEEPALHEYDDIRAIVLKQWEEYAPRKV